MNNFLRLFNFSLALTKLEIAFRVPQYYSGTPKEIYEILIPMAQSIDFELPSWREIDGNPESVSKVGLSLALKHPDGEDIINLGRMAAIFLGIGIKEKNDSWKPTRDEKKNNISEMLTRRGIPHARISQWLDQCDEINTEGVIGHFIELVNLIQEGEMKKEGGNNLRIDNNFGQINVADGPITAPSMNITLAELERKIKVPLNNYQPVVPAHATGRGSAGGLAAPAPRIAG